MSTYYMVHYLLKLLKWLNTTWIGNEQTNFSFYRIEYNILYKYFNYKIYFIVVYFIYNKNYHTKPNNKLPQTLTIKNNNLVTQVSFGETIQDLFYL